MEPSILVPHYLMIFLLSLGKIPWGGMYEFTGVLPEAILVPAAELIYLCSFLLWFLIASCSLAPSLQFLHLSWLLDPHPLVEIITLSSLLPLAFWAIAACIGPCAWFLHASWGNFFLKSYMTKAAAVASEAVSCLQRQHTSRDFSRSSTSSCSSCMCFFTSFAVFAFSPNFGHVYFFCPWHLALCLFIPKLVNSLLHLLQVSVWSPWSTHCD